MEFLINVLIFTNFFLTVTLVVALWERYENRRFPQKSEAEQRAQRRRNRQILDNWRR